MRTYFQDNPFWRNLEKTEAMTIFCQENDDGTIDRKQQPVPKIINGKENPLWTKLMEEIGPKVLDDNTEARRKEKIRKENETGLKKQQREKSVKLEELFALKLKAFEIDAVRDCKDTKLRSKVRSSKNDIEMQGWVSVILMKSLEETEDE